MVELAEAVLEHRIFIKGCNYQAQRILAARILTGKFQPAHVDLGQQAELIAESEIPAELVREP